MLCICYYDMVDHSLGNKSTCTVDCDPYVCGSPNGDAVSVYKRLNDDPSEQNSQLEMSMSDLKLFPYSVYCIVFIDIQLF